MWYFQIKEKYLWRNSKKGGNEETMAEILETNVYAILLHQHCSWHSLVITVYNLVTLASSFSEFPEGNNLGFYFFVSTSIDLQNRHFRT